MAGLWRALRPWLLLAALLGGGYAFLHLVVLAPKSVPVTVRAIGRGVVQATVSNTRAGSVRSRLSAALSADVPGRIVSIQHREGSRVEAGALLLALDDSAARALATVIEKERDTAAAALVQAEASLAEARREHERVRALHARQNVAQAELDRAATQLDLAEAAVRSATARVEQQKARLSQVAVDLEKLSVRAPFAGIVAELRAEVGEWATPGKPLVQFFDPARLYVRAELDEVDVGHVRTGLAAKVTLDPFKGRVFAGTIVRVAPNVSEVLDQNRTVAVEVELAGGTGDVELKPGMSADVEVVLAESRPDALRVPTLAILSGDRVLLADGGRAREATLTTGLRNWEWTEATAGIAEGDRVIVSLDREEVRAGARIVVAP
ncbi:MAG: efflux RND transporter periplasmic adaptor subunit [Planctomycetales bacterium]|nr:efflux RND transporter periplasmic adaptor subunit [Planctomycetales bacterium]